MSPTFPPPRPPDGDEPWLGPVMRAADGMPPLGACPDADVLALYADRELAADDMRDIERHVSGCGRCQATLAAVARSAPPLGAADPGHAVAPWWAGWRWIVPVAATASVVAVALWIGPSPSERVADTARRADSAQPEHQTAAGAPVPPPGANLAPQRDARAEPETFAAGAARSRTRPPANAPAAGAPTASADARAPLRAQIADPSAATPAPPAVEAEAPEAANAQPAARAEISSTASAPPSRAAASAPAPAVATAKPLVMRDAARTGAAGAGLARTAAQAELTGTVAYRARNALPAGAVVEVRLLDLSRADAPAATLARATIVTAGEQVPIPFTLRYAAGAIQARGRYTVEATIAIDGRVAWRTTTSRVVFAGGAPATSVALMLDPAP